MVIHNVEQAINVKIIVTTLLDQTHRGYLHSYSSAHDVLAIRTTNRSNNKNPRPESYKFINTAFIKSIQIVGPLPKRPAAVSSAALTPANSADGNVRSPSPQPSITPVKLSINELETELNRSLAKYKTMISDINNATNVSVYAKRLYEKLYSLFSNVKWHGDAIVVNDQVKICKPYLNKANNITKLTENVPELERVQLAVREFWQLADTEKGG